MTTRTETDREQPKALGLANKLAARKITNWVHATGDTPRSSGFCSDQECVEAATLLRTQHAELEDLRALLRTQRTVINDQQTELDRKSDAIQRLWAERDALRTEVERLRKDADRYRWLKSLPGARPDLVGMAIDGSKTLKNNFSAPHAVYTAPTIDAAIDAAREAKG